MKHQEQVLALVPLTSDPPFLGGKLLPAPSSSSTRGADNSENTINSLPHLLPPNTSYTNLRRPASLPSPHSKDLEYFPSPQAEAYFSKIFDGTLTVKYAEGIKVAGADDEVAIAAAAAYQEKGTTRRSDDHDDDNNVNLILEVLEDPTFYIMISYIAPDEVGNDCRSSLTSGTKLLEPMFNERQIEAILLRVIHRFYRDHAVQMSEFFRYQVYLHMQKRYHDKNWWSEIVDLTMTYVDAGFNSKSPDMAYNLARYGEALEGKGKFHTAALIYQDVAALLATNQITNSPERKVNECLVHGFAGVAYKRSGNFVEAEISYVKALKLENEILDFNSDSRAHMLISNIVTMYCASNNGGGPITDVDRRRMYFLGLLYAAGFRDTAAAYDDAKSFANFLKSKYQNKSAARKAFRTLAKSGTVDNFQTNLDIVRNPKKQFKLIKTETASFTGNTTSDRDTAKAFVKESLNINQSMNIKACSNPSCGAMKDSTTVLMQCPCKTVSYCSKECQVEHWKVEHKQTCPARRKSNNKTRT